MQRCWHSPSGMADISSAPDKPKTGSTLRLTTRAIVPKYQPDRNSTSRSGHVRNVSHSRNSGRRSIRSMNVTLAGHCLTATSISFGSTPAIKPKSRSRCRSGMLAKIACVAIRQSFADRGVTPAHRHRAYKCAALRAASRVSGAITIGNSPSTRSQRVNRSGLSAPWRTSCRIGGASQTGSPCSRAS
jgi:hypothetical protein